MFWMGNLSREEARTYFFDYVLPKFKHLPGANEAWERVYEVCGGNPGLLKKCGSLAAGRRSWKLGALSMPVPLAVALAALTYAEAS